jgi:hypothetical protein
MLAAFSLAIGFGIVASQSATAFPVAADAIQRAVTAGSNVEQAQYAERRGRGYITKCYREFVIGNYVCRNYRTW